MAAKLCNICGETKPLTEFHRQSSRPDGRQTRCKACYRQYHQDNRAKRRAAQAARYHADVEASRAYHKQYREANKQVLAERQRQIKYGVSAEQYAETVARQHGRCAICEAPPDHRGLCIDHCHETNVVRALLCFHCNHGIGHFRDDAQRMRAAADYVAAHQTKRLLPNGSPHDVLDTQNHCVGNSDEEGL